MTEAYRQRWTDFADSLSALSIIVAKALTIPLTLLPHPSLLSCLSVQFCEYAFTDHWYSIPQNTAPVSSTTA